MIERVLFHTGEPVLGEPFSAGPPAGAEEPLAQVEQEFPGVALRWTPVPSRIWMPAIAVDDWRSRAFPSAFDSMLASSRTEPTSVLIFGARPTLLAATALEVLTRYQHRVHRRNRWSAGPRVDRLLQAHRALHDLSRPLVAADYSHALDTWHWLLRLEPDAGLALQLAALFHDVERLISEADWRVEHLAEDYEAFKRERARAGARFVRGYLGQLGVDEQELAETERLVAAHEAPDGERAVGLLNEADALSFLSLNSDGFLDHYGEAHTQRKLALTLARLGVAAQGRVAQIRLRDDVARLWEELHRAPRQRATAEAPWSRR